uniref:Melanin-concentrating hormone n=1 Tax=Electrophorus electricus TaxID=8005 RepID=A0AAY5F040_ELEEL
MKLSIFSIFFTITILSGCNLQSEALTEANSEELDLDQETLGERLAESPLSSGASKIIVLGRTQLSLPERILRDASLDHSPSGVSIVRRDTRRCMVGRVYRPSLESLLLPNC